MKTFKGFAFWSTISTYFLIFVGGLVRVSGAGLGCPDWPKCFGRWIPPTSVDQLPADIDPNLFNFTLAWIEYVNRLIGLAVGLMIAITAVLAIVYMRRHAKVLIPSILAALLVAFQGWQGSQVVSSALEPFILTIHLGLALIIVSLLIYATQHAYYIDRDRVLLKGKQAANRIWIAALWILSLIQILFGTQIRSELQVIQDRFPLLTELEWLAKVGPVNQVHIFLGIVLLLMSLLVTVRMKDQGTTVKNLSVGLSVIMVIQLFIGFILVFVGLPELIQLIHLWLASLTIGVILILYTATAYERSNA